jgi:hypothetical protein
VFAPDFELEQTAALIDTAGSFRGRERVADALRELTDAFDNVRFEPQTAVELGPERFLFLVRFSASGRGSGVLIDQTVGHLFDFDIERGVAKRWAVYWQKDDALEAAGLSE